MPLVLTSQAIPVFALAPLLVLWFGFGMSAKVMMAVLVIFFPVTSAFLTVCAGLTTTISIWRARWGLFWRTAAPRSPDGRPSGPRFRPADGGGRRPIRAIIGEWVGSAEGLGYVMLNANARLQTDICFAALFILVLLTVLLWLAVDAFLHRLINWTPE